MKRPIVLTLSDYYRPGYKGGGPITTIVNMVSRLSTEFQFKIVTRDRDFGDKSPYPKIEPSLWYPVDNAEVCYLPPGMKGRSSLSRILNSFEYDVLYLNSLFSPAFTIQPLLLRRLGRIPNLPTVLAPRGELGLGALKLKAFKKQAYLRASRMIGLHQDIVWQASSSHEESEIRRWFGKRAFVKVAPDLAGMPSAICADDYCADKQTGRIRLLFLSRVCEKKNLAGALTMLQNVRGRVEFDIVGPLEDEMYWRKCQALIETLPSNVKVKYLGIVSPAEVPGLMRNHDLFFLPTFSENFGHVILEALSEGCPVLISDQTAWRDLQNNGAGWDLPLKRKDAFQNILQECIDMPAEHFAKLRQTARGYAEKYASQDEFTVQQNRDLFFSALGIDDSNEKTPLQVHTRPAA
jgi:glycosyltransferase involved in cell wall biosynthesis